MAIHHIPIRFVLHELDRRLLDQVVYGVAAHDSMAFRIMAK